MPFTSLATKVYKGAIDTVWANSIKANDDYLLTAISKSWVKFDGSAATVSAQVSQNVSSITDNGAGEFRINFTTGMATSGYVAVGMSIGTGAGNVIIVGLDNSAGFNSYSTGSIAIQTRSLGGTLTDGGIINLVVFGGGN